MKLPSDEEDVALCPYIHPWKGEGKRGVGEWGWDGVCVSTPTLVHLHAEIFLSCREVSAGTQDLPCADPGSNATHGECQGNWLSGLATGTGGWVRRTGYSSLKGTSPSILTPRISKLQGVLNRDRSEGPKA